jgi:peroxiredoxin
MVIVPMLVGVLCLAVPGPGSAGESLEKSASAEVGKAAPLFTLADVSGNKHSLEDLKGRYVVLEWTNMDCPFVRKHYDSGNMQTLQEKYREKDVVWLRICSSAPGKQGNFEPDVIEKRLEKEKSKATAYLIDADGKVGRMYAAKTTPHMFVIDPKGVLMYAGAIDSIKSTDKADIERATNYVGACLDAAMNDERIAVTTSVPYGCSVKYVKK